MKNKTIGFIGIGVMGKSMVRNLMQGGFSVHIFTRTKSKASDLIEEGAIWEDEISTLTKNSDIIITIVGFPVDVEEIYLGEKGIINCSREGNILIDMTTSKPSLAIEINKKALEKGVKTLDAPVSGGDIGAKNGTLSIMVGGEKETFNETLPLLELMGKNIVYQGKAGSGQHTKMCNQIAIATNMIGVCEALIYAKKAGLNEETVLKSITLGAAGSWSLSNLAPRIIKEDFSPGFFVKHFVKDMTIALTEAENMGLLTPGLKLSLELYKELMEQGYENNGTQVLYKAFNK
ncbi:NAD(P)-dependent oxidoreductase [Clostridium sediminicola]|uniref:NAD(P)-dependent oxidoreductase n=1 Tax=Clostridium sediminicola TaxID=3114879 RepID=UPI0031F27173